MAALGDLIIICAVGLVIAVLSLVLSKTPATLPFARRVPSSRPSATAPRRGRRVPSRPGLPVPFTTGASCSAGVSGSPGHAARQTVSTAPTTASSRPLRDSTQCLSPGQAPGQVVVRGFLLLGVRYLFAARRPSADPGPPAPATQRLDRAHMLLNVNEGREQRPRDSVSPSPREVRRAVYERDGGQCAECGSNSIFNMTTSCRWPWAAPRRSTTSSCFAEAATARRALTCRTYRVRCPPAEPTVLQTMTAQPSTACLNKT